MILFKLIILIFLIGVAAVVFMGVGLLWRVRSMLNLFRRQDSMGAGRQSAQTGQRERTGGVTDHRTQQQASRKIFTKDEGEYVDYVEDDSKED